MWIRNLPQNSVSIAQMGQQRIQVELKTSPQRTIASALRDLTCALTVVSEQTACMTRRKVVSMSTTLSIQVIPSTDTVCFSSCSSTVLLEVSANFEAI
mmetsp:Transcript_18070/g.37508  ORF Transcript_18070/g.37508 Transcript_18070/m.37508 type:complete len:98 (-) Transcript_18070:904-1197(-)